MKAQSTLLAVALTGSIALSSAPATLAQDHAHNPPAPPAQKWSFSGPFGKFDQGQLQRGFKVYREVCASCHSMNLVSFRNLAEAGGPGFSKAQAAAVAAEYSVKDIDEKGDPIERTGRLTDTFPAPFANDRAAAAANGVAPPDLSTIAKARTYERGFPWFVFDVFTQYQEQGPDYIAALLLGYKDALEDFKMQPGGNYNEYFPGHVIAMAAPLSDGQVSYDDDAPETLPQYATDVAAFLMWAAEPHLVQRKRIGFQAMVFLIILCGLLYWTKKKVWSAVH